MTPLEIAAHLAAIWVWASVAFAISIDILGRQQ